jgi:hypothetical protein
MRYFHVVKPKSGRFTMLDEGAMLLGVFCVLFIAASAFGQQQSDKTSVNPALSQSESVTIIREIHASELRTRNHIDKKSSELGTKISDIETSVALLDKEVSDLRWWLIAITTLILLPLVFPGLKQAWQKWIKGNRTSGTHSSAYLRVKEFGNRSRFPNKSHSGNTDTKGESG